jgi:hypothetical protein
MSRNQTNVQRSVKDILVSHEERIQSILKQLGQGSAADNRSVQNVEKKQHQQDELSKKMMMNQRTFNNSLQLLNGRLSKVEQLLVEVSLDIRNLKKRILSENNIHLDISEKTGDLVSEVAEAPKEVKVEDTPTVEATEPVKEEAQEAEKDDVKEEAQEAEKDDVKEEAQEAEKDDVKEEVKEEIKKTKKEKKGGLTVLIDEDKNEEF